MKIIPLPAEREARQRKARSLKRLAKAYNVCLLTLAIVAVACLIGVLVVVIMLEWVTLRPHRRSFTIS